MWPCSVHCLSCTAFGKRHHCNQRQLSSLIFASSHHHHFLGICYRYHAHDTVPRFPGQTTAAPSKRAENAPHLPQSRQQGPDRAVRARCLPQNEQARSKRHGPRFIFAPESAARSKRHGPALYICPKSVQRRASGMVWSFIFAPEI